MKKPLNPAHWSAEEVKTAARLWQEMLVDVYGEEIEDAPRRAVRAAFQAIGRAIGRPADSVCERFATHGASFQRIRASDPADNLRMARDARAAASRRRDATASVFGDPPPGYSALDQKNAGRARA